VTKFVDIEILLPYINMYLTETLSEPFKQVFLTLALRKFGSMPRIILDNFSLHQLKEIS